jgi:hypothetical protein
VCTGRCWASGRTTDRGRSPHPHWVHCSALEASVTLLTALTSRFTWPFPPSPPMHVLSIIAPLLGNDHLRDTYDSVTRQVVSDPSASGHHPMRSRDLFGGGQIAAILLVYSSLFPPQSSPYHCHPAPSCPSRRSTQRRPPQVSWSIRGRSRGSCRPRSGAMERE